MIAGEALTKRGIVEAASIAVAPGEFVVLLGPNGAGKTTLLRLLLGLERADSGTSSVARLPAAERARQVAYLPQMRPLAWPAKVRDVVALGRFAHGAAPTRMSERDRAAVDLAIRDCDLGHLRDRPVDTLSGGEVARVHLARALAADAPFVIADEPVASLDPRHQLAVLDLLTRFVARGGGALVVLHDLTLAMRYASRLVWMDSGRIIADGAPAETMTAGRIADVYGVAARVAGGRIDLLSPIAGSS
jgi:iron complex transport system ATP-binding protein